MTLDSRSDELDKKLEDNDMDSSIATLVKDARTRKNQLRLLAVSLFLEFVLTGVLGSLVFRTNDLAHQAQTTKAALIQNCETANDSRNNQRTLWGYVLSLTPQQPRSPEQEDRVQEFAKFVDATFAERDCLAEANKPVDK